MFVSFFLLLLCPFVHSFCNTSNVTECLLDDCVWSASSYNCIDKIWAQSSGDSYRKVGLEWQNAANTEIIGVSATGNVFQYSSELSPVPSRSISFPDPAWDVVCENGGMKRWEVSKGGILGLHPEKKNQVFGNAECMCNEGWAGLTCRGCSTDAGCTGNPAGKYCRDYDTFESGREVVCNPTHNGAVAGASDFGNDTVIKLLNDYIMGYDRLSFVPDGKGGFSGSMLKPTEYPGERTRLSSPHLFAFEATSDCKWYKGPCKEWVEKDKTGLKAQGLASPWAENAQCTTVNCKTMDVTCPPKGDPYRWSDTCTQFLKPLFTGSIQLVCNSEKMSDLHLMSTNFSHTPYACAMFVYEGNIAFLSDCNAAGYCSDVSPSPTPGPSPTPTPPGPSPAPSPGFKHHTYCHKHSSWCYPVEYFSMYGLPMLMVMICCFILLSFNAGFVPRLKNGKIRTSCCHSCCATSVARSKRAQNGRKASVNVLVQRLTRGVSNVSRLPANTEEDLQLPFLVDDALQNDKNKEETDSSDGVWVHAKDVKFAIPQSYVQKAAKNLGVDMNSINAPRAQILDGVSNVFGPTLTGILGPSGCGKTSFLDIIAGRKTLGTVSGDVYLNGRSLNVEERRRCIGYVTQEDVLQGSATAWEVLAFHAALRMPVGTTAIERSLAVDSMLETLRLSHRADMRVGSSDHKGLSGGEKRRVSIGIQLLAGCRVIVLDEPLSGLDSSSALLVLDALERLVANRNHAVIMTVHQPSSRLLNKFGHIMLLSPHGRLAYAGPRSSCVDHFVSIGLPKLPMGYSPAEYLLDVVTPDSNRGSVSSPSDVEKGDSKTQDDRHESPRGLSRERLERREMRLESLFKKSERFKKSEKKMRDLEDKYKNDSSSSTDEVLLSLTSKDKVNATFQFAVILQREVVNSLRVPTLFLANVGISLGVGLFCAALFHSMQTDLDGLISRSGLFFFAISYYMLSTITGLGLFQEARLLYLHEKTSGAYGPTPYFLATFLCDTMLNRFIPVLCFTLAIYWPSNLRWHPVAMINFGCVVMLSSTCSAAIMSCIALIFRRLPTAQLVGSMLCMCWMLLAGALLNPGTLGTLRWLLKFSPLNYAFDMLMINEFGRGAVFSINPRGLDVKVIFTGTQVLDQFFVTEDDFHPQMVGLLVITSAALLLSYILLRFFLKERR